MADFPSTSESISFLDLQDGNRIHKVGYEGSTSQPQTGDNIAFSLSLDDFYGTAGGVATSGAIDMNSFRGKNKTAGLGRMIKITDVDRHDDPGATDTHNGCMGGVIDGAGNIFLALGTYGYNGGARFERGWYAGMQCRRNQYLVEDSNHWDRYYYVDHSGASSSADSTKEGRVGHFVMGSHSLGGGASASYILFVGYQRVYPYDEHKPLIVCNNLNGTQRWDRFLHDSSSNYLTQTNAGVFHCDKYSAYFVPCGGRGDSGTDLGITNKNDDCWWSFLRMSDCYHWHTRKWEYFDCVGVSHWHYNNFTVFAAQDSQYGGKIMMTNWRYNGTLNWARSLGNNTAEGKLCPMHVCQGESGYAYLICRSAASGSSTTLDDMSILKVTDGGYINRSVYLSTPYIVPPTNSNAGDEKHAKICAYNNTAGQWYVYTAASIMRTQSGSTRYAILVCKFDSSLNCLKQVLIEPMQYSSTNFCVRAISANQSRVLLTFTHYAGRNNAVALSLTTNLLTEQTPGYAMKRRDYRFTELDNMSPNTPTLGQWYSVTGPTTSTGNLTTGTFTATSSSQSWTYSSNPAVGGSGIAVEHNYSYPSNLYYDYL